jgi:cytochrome c peroxidase
MVEGAGMQRLRPAATIWRSAAAIAALGLLLWGGASVAGDPPLDRASWQQKYRRPAAIPYPKDNPYSEAKFVLGQMLYFDPRLSRSQTTSCATCHNPALSWSNGLPRGIGDSNDVLGLRVPTLLNVAWVPRPGWNGHFRDLENVTFGPISGPTNMNMPAPMLVERLSAIPGYLEAFDAAFGEGEITKRKTELALATYERSIVSTEASFDRWINGDEGAISAAAKRGFDLFNNKAHCVGCHSGWAFTDSSFHDIGSATGDDIGRGKLFKTSVKLRYAFKTPTLRDVTRRAPYMHDGSVATLREVIDLYDRGGIERPSRSNLIFPLKLTEAEKADLMAFLQTLTGKPEQTPMPIVPR